MKALVFLCQKSIVIREKMMQKKEKLEECDEDNTAEAHTIYEEEEIGDCEIHS